MTIISFQSLQHKTASFTEDEIKGEHYFKKLVIIQQAIERITINFNTK